MLVIALAASVCGAESRVDFAELAEDREVLLREFLSLDNGLPSHDRFSRLFRLLDPQAFGRVFAAFLDDPGADGPGVLAPGGKTLRRSFDRVAGRSPRPVVTAFGAGAGLVIGQRAVAEGGNGITAARALLETLCLDGVLVTADALHTQSDTASLILERGGDYLFALKDNHPLLMRDVAEYFADPEKKMAAYQTVDADHGRIETRVHRVSHDVGWLFSDRRYKDEPRFPGLACIASVQSTRQAGATGTHATRYHLASARLTPQTFAAAVRAHRAIENRLPCVLDMAFNEDRARNRKDNGPENLTILRKRTLNLLRTARPNIPVSRKRQRAAWSDDFARTILGHDLSPGLGLGPGFRCDNGRHPCHHACPRNRHRPETEGAGMDKARSDVREAVAGIAGGMTVKVGGFGGSGALIKLIHARIDRFVATGHPKG
jgi:predicted transposase YbfD/YdcC